MRDLRKLFAAEDSSSNVLLTWCIRLTTVAALLIFFVRALNQWLITPTLTLSLVIAGEVVTMTIYLSARFAKSTSPVSVIAVVSTLMGTFFFYFVVLEPGPAIVPTWLSAQVQMLGVLWQIFAKISLGRSFGLLPANRGVVTTYAYRVVRHPIYLGYLVGHIGFQLGSFDWRNVPLLAALWFFQVLRIFEEEKVLRADPAYLTYMARTRFRLVPGLL